MSYINETNRSTKLAALVVATGFISCFGSTMQDPNPAIASDINLNNEYDNPTEAMYDIENEYMQLPDGEKLKTIIINDVLVKSTNNYIKTKK